MRLYYFLGTILRPPGLVGLYLYSAFTKTARVRVIVRSENGSVLLVQTWLSGGKWGLPGGGARRSEQPERAACRELAEEAGVVVKEDTMRFLYTFRAIGHNEIIFTTSVAQQALPEQIPSKYEVKSAAWFSIDKLPPLEPLTSQIMAKSSHELTTLVQ